MENFEHEVLERLARMETKIENIVDEMKRMNGSIKRNKENIERNRDLINKVTISLVIVGIVLILAIPAVRGILPVI